MENKHLETEAALVRKILGYGSNTPLDSNHSVLVEDWEHSWKSSEEDQQAYNFSYILNPTGTIRWFFPSDTQYPAYLSLYNSAHLKARVYKLCTHAAFSLNLQKKLFSGSFSIKTSKLPFQDLLKTLDAETYAVFTGTVGENRKSVAAIYRNKSVSHFVKLSHSDKAKEILSNEEKMLKYLSDLPFFRLDHPRVHPDSKEGCLILSNIKPTPAREVARLEDMHIEVLSEIYKFTAKEEIMASSTFYREIHENLSRICTREVLDPAINNPVLNRIIDNLIKLTKSLSPAKFFQTSLAHGDFTPWNMYLSDNYVHLYDWELSRKGLPLFFDLYHYMYQSGVLLLRQNYDQILREISRSFRLPHSKRLCKQYGLDLQYYHKLYLLYIISYYLRIYMDEESVHMQVHWLMDIWDQALQHTH